MCFPLPRLRSQKPNFRMAPGSRCWLKRDLPATSEQRPFGVSDRHCRPEWECGYLDLNGSQETHVTDPVGRSLNFAYYSSGRITSVTDPVGRVVRYSYSAAQCAKSSALPKIRHGVPGSWPQPRGVLSGVRGLDEALVRRLPDVRATSPLSSDRVAPSPARVPDRQLRRRNAPRIPRGPIWGEQLEERSKAELQPPFDGVGLSGCC